MHLAVPGSQSKIRDAGRGSHVHDERVVRCADLVLSVGDGCDGCEELLSCPVREAGPEVRARARWSYELCFVGDEHRPGMKKMWRHPQSDPLGVDWPITSVVVEVAACEQRRRRPDD